MSKPAIALHSVSKSFKVSMSGAGSFKTSLLWWRKKHMQHFSVLDNLSIEIAEGSCTALIGKNGAGKSTLLSLIARVYLPDSGSIELNGRIAPLLELGAGFHPDLTGRENVLFNGMILGLTRKQAHERTPSIIEFSELATHIDAPVRTYSSGMLARLGFAVAMHVDASILIVDEVLAVGDYDFEQKCYTRIGEFRDSGGTILFVSHDTDTVKRISDRALWLRNGKIVEDGDPTTVVENYLRGESDLKEAQPEP